MPSCSDHQKWFLVKYNVRHVSTLSALMHASTHKHVCIYIHILIHLVYVSTCVPFSTCTCYPPGCSRSGGSVSSQSGLQSGPSQGGSQDSLPRAMCHGGHGSFVGQVEWSTSPSSRDGNNPHMPQIYIYIYLYICLYSQSIFIGFQIYVHHPK